MSDNKTPEIKNTPDESTKPGEQKAQTPAAPQNVPAPVAQAAAGGAAAAPAPASAAPPPPPSNEITLTIDGRSVTVPKGTLVVDAAQKLGIEIPVFCSHPKLDPVACCRMCLVEISGPRGPMLQTACSVPVAQDMVVNTETQQVRDVQEANLAFILLNHPLDCPICDKGGECPLQDQTMRYGPGISQLVEAKRHKNKHYMISDTIVLDQERCVVCWRCIRYLEEWEDKPQLGLFERGGKTIIDIQDGVPVSAKTSGNIIDICPVGALTNRVARFSFRPWEIERTPSICGHCSMGCNVRMDSRTHVVRRIIGRENMAVNDQWICDKGRFAHGWINHPNRIKTPYVRKNGVLTAVTWSEALEYTAKRLQEIKRTSGADSIGAIGSAKLSNESNYLLQRLFRQVIGTNNIDHRGGANVAAVPTGLPAIVDVMKPQYGPNPKADVIFVVGIDTAEEMPVLDLHLKRAVRRGGSKMIIAHPRKVEATRYKGPYLAYKPGTEVALINGLTRIALSKVENAPAGAADLVADATNEQMTQMVGADLQEIDRAAELLANAKHALIIYGPMAAQGEAGPQLVQALQNLAIVTGHAERVAFVGLESNSQGVRDMGVLPNMLPGYVALNDEKGRKAYEKAWGHSLPTNAGKSYHEMLEDAGESIKALYVMGANPASERPTWAANLDKLDLLIVQDLFITDTAKFADVVLPAVSWAEQDGTFTNVERRVQRAVKAVRDPESKAAPDWMILDHLAARLGAHFPYADEKAITQEIGKVVPCYAGISWDALGDQGVQWDAKLVAQKPTLKRAEQPVPSVGEGYDLVTGTVSYDGGDLFSLTKQMQPMAFQPSVGIHPEDALKAGLVEGAMLSVRSDLGELVLPARLDETVQPGTVWIPESLTAAPVGALLNGHPTEKVRLAPANA